MDSGKIPLEYKELIREFHPKRDQMNKIHRWRYTTLEDNLITKTVFIDRLKVDEQLGKAVYKKIAAHLNEDWTGIEASVLYSLKKQKRWELPNFLENNLPSFESGCRMPLPINGTSLARFETYRTLALSPRITWYYKDFGYYCRRRVKGLTVVDQNGERKTYLPGINKGHISRIVRSLQKEMEASVPTVHVQFQTLEFKLVPRKHNSRKWEFSGYDYRSHDYQYNHVEPILNAQMLHEELYECECGHFDCLECRSWLEQRYPDAYCCSFSESRAPVNVYTSCVESANVSIVYLDTPYSPIFGDFFDVHNIPREKRSKKRGDLTDWVLM